MPKRRLLIVDDESENLAQLGNILREDYELSFACTGAEALTMALTLQPALVLLDVGLPDMDGYMVCRTLKRNPVTEEIPVIFITGYIDPRSEEIGFEAGCIDYLHKPVLPAIMLSRVRAQLSMVRAINLEKSHREAVYMLAQAGDYNDTDTGVHIWRMAAYCRILSEILGWDREKAEMLELAATLHDTGKIGIPDSILKKPGSLDADEWSVMKSHTLIGHQILSKNTAPLFELAAQIALRHHEKWDGTGYPGGLMGTHIPEAARIVAVADVFDALSMKRPYKDPWPLERILENMRAQSGRHFDPHIIEAFEASLPRILDVKLSWDQIDDAEKTPSLGELS